MKNTKHVLTTTAVAVGLVCAAAAPATAMTAAPSSAFTRAAADHRATGSIRGSSTELRYVGGSPVVDVDGEHLAFTSARDVVVSGVASAPGRFHLVDQGKDLCDNATQGSVIVCQIADLAPGDRTLTAYVETADGERTEEFALHLHARTARPVITSATRTGDTATIVGTANPGARIEVAGIGSEDVLARADATDGTFRVEVPVVGAGDAADAFRVRAVLDLAEDVAGDPDEDLGTSAWELVDIDETTDPGDGGDPVEAITPPGDVDPGFTPQPGDGGDPGEPTPGDLVESVSPEASGNGVTDLTVRGTPGTVVTATDPFGKQVSGCLDASGWARLQLAVPSQLSWTVHLSATKDGATTDRDVEIGSGPRGDQGFVVRVSSKAWTPIWFAGATGSVTFRDASGAVLTSASANSAGWGMQRYGVAAGTTLTATDSTGATATVVVVD